MRLNRLSTRAATWNRARYPAPLLVADLLAFGAGFFLGGLGRIGIGDVELDWASIIVLGAIAAIGFLVAGFALHLYRARFLVGSFDEVIALAGAWTAAGLVAAVVNGLAFQPRVPLSVFGLGMLLSAAGMLATRAAWRLNERAAKRPDADGRTRVVVFGAGEGAELVVRSMLSDPTSQYVPIAILDDDAHQQNRSIEGVRVCGFREQISDFADKADALLIAIPSAGSPLITQLSQLAEDAGLDVMVLPSTTELIGSLVTHDTVRALDISDLLGRDEVQIDDAQVSAYLTGRTVLVTGAGGSIGSELCRQILWYEPERLVMVDRDETALQGVQLSIDGHGLLDNDNLVLADIRDRDGVFAVFDRFQPDIVFHAAALKHLPMLESHPREALLTNVLGTKNVLDAASAVGVDRFVNVSTDKAANPISILGHTKRIAEALTVETGFEAPGHYVSVRFGNVLGSRGSVLPLFEAQIDAGEPLRITDPQVTRYFMSIPEASRLVLQAGAIGKTGETMVLDMGEPVKIIDLAHRLLKHRKADVDLEITGLRTNEKLHEELGHEGETMTSREHPRIWHTEAVASAMREHLDSLDGLDDDALRARLAALTGAQADGETSLLSSLDTGQRVFLSPPDMSTVERARLIETFDSNWLASVGPDLEAFEAGLAEWTERPHAVALSSGTAALHLSLLLAGVEPGDEVLVSSMTFVATANAVLMAGGVPVFVDSSQHDWNIDPALVEDFLAKRAAGGGPMPKAVLSVDLYGQCADYRSLETICERYGVTLLSDSAESLGASRDGRRAGSAGTLAVLSFNGNKIITTAGGGALLADDPALIERARYLATQARLPAAHYEHAEPGFNYRMSNLQAAVGRGQLERLPDMIDRRAAIGERYHARLGPFDGVDFMPVPLGSAPNSWMHVLTIDPQLCGVHRDDLHHALGAENIESRPAWKPMHLQPLFADAPMIGGAVSERVFETGLCLPSGSAMTNGQVDRIADIIEQTLAGKPAADR